MIFVTVGTDTHDFSRLIKAMDEIAKSKKVIIQRGNTSYLPRNAESFGFTSEKEMNELYKKADIIVTHAGAGSIINSLNYGKRPIVVPRLKQFDEHTDNHQLETAAFMNSRRLVIGILDVNDIKGIVEKGPFKIEKKKRGSGITKYLEEWLNAHFSSQSTISD